MREGERDVKEGNEQGLSSPSNTPRGADVTGEKGEKKKKRGKKGKGRKNSMI